MEVGPTTNNPEVAQQVDLLEAFGNKEVTMFGETDTFNGLMDMCPLDPNDPRMTLEAKNQFVVKAANEAGLEIEPEYEQIFIEITEQKGLERKFTVAPEPTAINPVEYAHHQPLPQSKWQPETQHTEAIINEKMLESQQWTADIATFQQLVAEQAVATDPEAKVASTTLVDAAETTSVIPEQSVPMSSQIEVERSSASAEPVLPTPIAELTTQSTGDESVDAAAAEPRPFIPLHVVSASEHQQSEASKVMRMGSPFVTSELSIPAVGSKTELPAVIVQPPEHGVVIGQESLEPKPVGADTDDLEISLPLPVDRPAEGFEISDGAALQEVSDMLLFDVPENAIANEQSDIITPLYLEPAELAAAWQAEAEQEPAMVYENFLESLQQYMLQFDEQMSVVENSMPNSDRAADQETNLEQCPPIVAIVAERLTQIDQDTHAVVADILTDITGTIGELYAGLAVDDEVGSEQHAVLVKQVAILCETLFQALDIDYDVQAVQAFGAVLLDAHFQPGALAQTVLIEM